MWPKNPPPLSPEQALAREAFMALWHRELPGRYAAIETFNHGYVAGLPLAPDTKTLEIGAGLGAHLSYENLGRQEYHALELRSSFCESLRQRLGDDKVHEGDIQKQQPWNDGAFDRIVAIHVLEHLPNLPKALQEISRLLRNDGCLDVVIPCEGGLAHRLARRISAERLFRKHFQMDFTPIRKNEHVSTCHEILHELSRTFQVAQRRFFPTRIPVIALNFCLGMRLHKRPEPAA